MDVTNHKCPNCNFGLPFDPHKGLWVCKYCKSEFTEEDLLKQENLNDQKNDNEEKMSDENQSNENTNESEVNMDIYNCPSCGAQLIADENTTATFCIYCKNPTIIKSKFTGEFKPEFIIPFKTTKQDAIDAFNKFKKIKWFVPDEFNSSKIIQEITGIYIPFWLYSCNIDAKINVCAKKIRTWISGNYRYTKTDTYTVNRDGTMSYKRVPADASQKFDDSIMDSIEPYNYSNLKKFNYSYISGFISEKYDVDKDEAFIRAKTRVNNTSIDQLNNTIVGYSSKSITNSSVEIDELNTEYVLLPVWLLNTRYKDKIYTFAMNGQTSKFIGNIPISIKKLITKSLIIFSLSFIIIFLLLYLLS